MRKERDKRTRSSLFVGRELSFNISQGSISGGNFGNPHFVPSRRSIQDVVKEIRKGDVKCLRLHGFDNTQVIRGSGIHELCRALESNTSIVDVTISWSSHEPIVGTLLETVAALPRLHRLILRSYTWILEKSVIKILSNRSLKELECQGVWVRTATGVRQTIAQSLMDSLGIQCDLTKLRLIRCSLRDDDCVLLRGFSRRCSNLMELSVQGNRRITGIGLALLVGAKVRRLDITKCDVSNKDLSTMIQEKGSFWPQELILAQNDRISIPDTASFLQFAEFCVAHLELLDMTACRIREEDLRTLLRLLRSDNCRLKSFLCEGNFSMPVQEIAQTLAKNRSLLSMVLTTCQYEEDVQLDQQKALVTSLQRNYNLQSLEITSTSSEVLWFEQDDEPDAISKEIDFLLRLNQAGRKVLLEAGSVGNPAILREILKKTSNYGDDVLFWFLKNGLSTHIACPTEVKTMELISCSIPDVT